MKIKLVTIFSMLLLLTAVSAAAQPKIQEFTTSLDETYTFSEFDSGDKTVGQIQSDKEVVVTDDTEVTLCVTEVEKEAGDTIRFRKLDFNTGNHGEYDTDNCKTWKLDKSDYQSEWRFDIRIKNQDDIGYSGGDYDYQIIYKTTNLVLPEESQKTDTYQYDTVQLSRTEYNRLKEQADTQSSSTSDNETPKVDVNGSIDADGEPIDSTLEQKNQKISHLQNRIQELEQTIDRLQQTIEELNQTAEDAGSSDEPQPQSSAPEEAPTEDRGMFGFLGSLFG